MQLKQIANKTLVLVSSKENEAFDSLHIFQSNGLNITFRVSDLEDLESFEHNTTKETLSYILSTTRGINRGLLSYKNEEGLKVYVQNSNSYLAIVSAGEHQPSLYKIYIESIYEKLTIG
jgi:hypothetical protein